MHCIGGERHKWKEEQKEAIMTLMDKLTKEQKPPRKQEILDLQFKYPCLHSRPWKEISLWRGLWCKNCRRSDSGR
jgi:hypothetical protein